MSACSSSAAFSELEQEESATWIVVSGEVTPDVVAFLGPAPGGKSRVVATRADRTILRVREADLESLSGFFHDRFQRCGGFTAHTSLADAEAALAAETSGVKRGARVVLAATAPEVVGRLIPLVSATAIRDTIQGLTSFPTRHYRSTGGVDAASWLRARWTTMAAGRAGAAATLFPHAGWPQPSVLLTIPGDEIPEEVVVIGGHLDSINSSGATSAPGADDDASGVATLTEVARLLLTENIRLRRTIIFMAYAAEEVGLRGSAEIAADFAARDVPVAGVMQLDMTNFDGSPHDIVLITDNVDPAHTNFLAELAAKYVPQFPVARDRCGYACSDHASWTRNGFPAVLPFEATMATYNRNIHTTRDTLAISGNNADHAAKFAKLAVAYAVEMAQVVE